MAEGSYRDVPLFRRLALAFAARPPLLDFVSSLPDQALIGGLLFSTLHYLVLADSGEAFAVAWHHEEQAPGSVADLEMGLEAFVLEHEAAISAVVGRHRGAQTNEVNRCAYLLPALAVVAAARARPLALLEIGSSAGLLLNFDRYSYRYNRAIYHPNSAVTVVATLRGRMPRLDVPDVGWRLGVDRAPVDVADEDAARWLLANIYPGDTERAQRTTAAIVLAREHPLPVATGEASELVNLAQRAPDTLALTVITTALLMYLDPSSRIDFRRAVEEIGATRSVDWLMCEPPGVLASLGADVSDIVMPHATQSGFVGPVVHIATDRPEPELLAVTGPHGRWIEWLANETSDVEATIPTS